MLCDLCGRPEESHVCTADFTKLLAESAKLRAEVEHFKARYENACLGCNAVTEELKAANLQIGAMVEYAKKNCVNPECGDVGHYLEGALAGRCCEGYAKHCDAHSVGCLFGGAR